MEFKKKFTGSKMNKDFDVRFVPAEDYIDAQNILISNSEGSSVGLAQNSFGVDKLTNLNLPVGAKTIGSVSDEGNECIYWLVTSRTSGYDANYIFEYDLLNNGNVTTVLADTRPIGYNVLNFNEDYKITGINVIYNSFNGEKLLVWTDNYNPIRCINIKRAKGYSENGFNQEDISLYKKPPFQAPSCTPTIFGDGEENNIKERFLSFAYRYKYLDGEYSALSSFTNPQFYPSTFSLNYQTNENDGMVNVFNAINVKFNTGGKNVTEVQLVFKESNDTNVYIIETFNKKKKYWPNNVEKTFLFSNNKIYSVLPVDEINRLFDNIPELAKAQEFIGNRLIYGNYTEGKDLVDGDNRPITVSYDVDFTSQNLNETEFPFAISTTTYADDTITIDFTGAEIKKGSTINFYLKSTSPSPYFGNYKMSLSLFLENSYNNAYFLSQSLEFQNFITNICSNDFKTYNTSSAVPVNEVSSYVDKYQPFLILTSSNPNGIRLQLPHIKYQINDGVAPVYYVTERFGLSADPIVSISNGNTYSSCKSNRSYEVGICYLDSDGRYSTVITDETNTKFIPVANSTTKNSLEVTIKHKPPVWADRYKLFVKDNKLDYQTIFATIGYKDDNYTWLMLSGQDKQKVKDGDYLILKKDIYGPNDFLTKCQVLEYKDQQKDFLEGNNDLSGDPILEKPGVYIKLKTIGGIDIDNVENNFFKVSKSNAARVGSPDVFAGPFSTLVGSTITDVAITAGSLIDISILNTKYGSSGGREEYKKSFIAGDNYSNFEDWFNFEANGLSPFVSYQFRRLNTNLTPNPSGYLYLFVDGLINGNGNHPSRLYVDITIQSSAGLLVFETDPIDKVSEVFYETQDTYLIQNGNHLSNPNVDLDSDQDYTTNTPAVINLDFFNCYVQGNGVESYIIKDTFNKNYLSTNSRPNAVQYDGYKKVNNIASLTYSGPLDKSISYNSLNEFNLSRANYKDLDDRYGSIQKLHARDTDLIVFQEDKVHKVLFAKSILTDAGGNAQLTSIETVLGQEVPYSGEWGISKDPESFAQYGNSVYFTDALRGSVLRLGGDGIEPISRYGMKDWFKDNLDVYKKYFKLGGYDPLYDNYVLAFTSDVKGSLIANIDCGVSYNSVMIPSEGQFKYSINVGDKDTDVTMEYSIDDGYELDFLIELDGNAYTYSVFGTGNIVYSKTAAQENAVITISNGYPDNVYLSLSNPCPELNELEVITLVVNDVNDVSKSMINQYNWYNSTYEYGGSASVSDTFDPSGVTRFSTDFGEVGGGPIPYNGSDIRISSIKESGEFKPCNRLGYLVSSINYDAQGLLDNATYIPHTTDGDENYIDFTLSITTGQKLYIVFDYRDIAEVSLCYDTVRPVLETFEFCITGIFPCDDEIHDPAENWVKYYDEYGVLQTEYYFCSGETKAIVASSIHSFHGAYYCD